MFGMRTKKPDALTGGNKPTLPFTLPVHTPECGVCPVTEDHVTAHTGHGVIWVEMVSGCYGHYSRPYPPQHTDEAIETALALHAALEAGDQQAIGTLTRNHDAAIEPAIELAEPSDAATEPAIELAEPSDAATANDEVVGAILSEFEDGP